jgi:L-alanine-DL-glutamate epimerase-like enolase superfamily enzyme
MAKFMGALRLSTQIEEWPRATPVRITGYTTNVNRVLVASLELDGHVGRAEAAGVYYRSDDVNIMREQIEQLRPTIERGLSRDSLQEMLPPGGARNALDCALWDLEAKISRRPVWQIAGLPTPRRLVTTFTCHADDPPKMADRACSYPNARAVKLKLTGEPIDAERVRAVRAALPDVWLAVDANQGFSRAFIDWLMPVLVRAKVALIEQPFPLAERVPLTDLRSPIPIAADESVRCLADIPGLVGHFTTINIKLDKCGGLTEALSMVQSAKALGLDVMVGNMTGTSLAMAPAFLVGQLCSTVDLDGPMFIQRDRDWPVQYEDGCIQCPAALWGGG